MSESGNSQHSEVLRKPSLIAGTTKKMALTYASSTVCAALVVIVDSLIAGISIGEEALAAIAAAAPLLSLMQILHCLLGFGIDKLMVQAIGEGKREEADRIFGAVLIAVVVVYLIVFGLMIVFERPLLELILTNPTLIDMVIDYTVPLFASEIVFEAFLCIERAFRIDGKAKLFSKRGIVTNIANILFDILLVSILHLGVSGLAWASVISTAIGYTITLSHFFSKKRTVSPDFSVLSSMQELLSYVRKDIRLGTSATLDEVMGGVVLAAQTAAIGAIGGSGGLAIWAVYRSLLGVALSVGNGVSASVSVHAGLLYGQGDYRGVRDSVKAGVWIALAISLGAALFVLLLADSITVAYGIEPAQRALGDQCLRIGCVVFPAIVFLTVINSYLPAVDKIKLTNLLVIIQHGLTNVPAILGCTLGLRAFFASYVGAVCSAALVLIVLLVRDRFWFVPERNPETIAEYSIQLMPNQISAMSSDMGRSLVRFGYPASFCHKMAMMIEDCMCYIEQQNANERLYTDIVLKRRESDILVTVTDEGMPYNPITDYAQGDWGTPGVLEAIVILNLSEDLSYDRVLDLNCLSLLVKPTATVRPSQGEETEHGPSL